MPTILVTGALGQIGAELVPALRARYGADNVIATDLKVLPPSGAAAIAPYGHLDCTEPHQLHEAVSRYDVGTIYHLAHRGIEQLTLDRGAAHLKDELAPRYAELVYNGFWFSPEREMLQAAIDHSQEKVTGTVRLKLYKGGVYVVGRKSPFSLYSEKVVTFEDDQGAYDQRDAAGFIKLNALRLRLLGRRDR